MAKIEASHAFHCLLTIVALIHCGSCLQVKLQQQQVAPTATTTVTQVGNQQQQQHIVASSVGGTQPEVSPISGKPPSKSNHRLVNKLKDARHRRRIRHHRHRHYRDKAVSLIETSPQAAATTLIALESIVEEVARAGQLPASSPISPIINPQQQQPTRQQQSQSQQQPANPQQQQQQQQQAAQSQAVSGTDLLLDGSSSPASQLHPSGNQPNQLPVLAANNHHQAPIPTPNTGITKGPHNNARGFFLTSMLSKIMNVLNVTEFALEMRDGISSRASCMACNAVVGLFLSPLYSKEVFSAAIRTVCTSFKIQPARVCSGLVEGFQDDFEFIRKNTKLSRDEICAVVFGVDCARRQTYNLFWTVPIPELTTGSSSSTRPNKLDPTMSDEQNTNTNGYSIPANEQAMIGMEDAPDLFGYRKSIGNSPSSDDKQISSEAAASSARLTNNPADSGSLEGQNIKQSDDQSVMVKKAKMLKRTQYIFDDDQLLETSSNSAAELGVGRNRISSFVHITDIHIDPYYQPGSLNDCNEPLCCRATSGPVPIGDKRRQAGRWGDYGNCDTPVQTLRSALNRIREEHSNAEYWLWTGDISPHDIWNISKAEAANHVRLVSKMVREYSNGVPVFPVIGNHEAHPVNSFSPPEIKGKFSMSWLYDVLADEWSDWLPKEALKTLRVGGYYKLLVRKGFRIIALNTNYCARLNPWSFYDPVDPANQLKWLVDELLEAEINQDKVHIIGHVPPDNRECTQAWLFNFINIVDRFRDTIIAQFYGHTHRDEWRLMYSLKRVDEPIGIQYIGPSITPFTENNPAYRIYHQDKSGYLVDSETYFFNLTEANETPTSEPNWQFSYRTGTNLNMTRGLTPDGWHQYLQRLHDDDELFDEFFRRYYRSSDVKQGQVCKAKCRYQMLSDLRLSHPYKTKPKPFLANRKTSNHHRDRHDNHHHYNHHHHKRLRHSD